MSFAAKVFNIFIASPSDVPWARTMVRQEVQAWNEANTRHRGVILFPVGWETNVAPSMGAAPQDIINKKLLADADILVGVFWTKLGTPTEEYASGSVEEIERHIAAEKPTLLYFSSQPAEVDSVDRDEYEKLVEFRKSCETRGLYKRFGSPTEFSVAFSRHLTMHLNELIGNGEEKVGIPAVRKEPTLLDMMTPQAITLLKEAALDKNGLIMYIRHLGGEELQTNGKSLIPDGGRREVAKWEAALEFLLGQGLVKARGHKNELFDVTDKGYQVAEQL